MTAGVTRAGGAVPGRGRGTEAPPRRPGAGPFATRGEAAARVRGGRSGWASPAPRARGPALAPGPGHPQAAAAPGQARTPGASPGRRPALAGPAGLGWEPRRPEAPGPGRRQPRSAKPRSASRARRAPGPLLSGQRDPPIGALGPALGRWILAPHTHRASLPRFAARADWLQYRTPKPNQRLQPPLPPPLPLPRKMANPNKGESGLPPTASAQAPQRPRP